MYGFCDSGKTISLVTQEDIQRVIDKAHVRVYGEERLARKQRLKPLEDESGEPDWDAFDSPTFERKGGNGCYLNRRVIDQFRVIASR